MCRKHLWRYERYRDPLVTIRGGGRRLVEAAAHATANECILFGDGTFRPTVQYDGKHMSAARLVWIIAHGSPGDAQVLHSCSGGSGAFGCINIMHLRLGDHVENMRDRAEAGRTARPGAILTVSQVLKIRQRYVKRAPRSNPGSSYALSVEFRVSPEVVRDAATGKTWSKVSPSAAHLGTASG